MAHPHRPSPSDEEPRPGRRDDRRRENRGRDDQSARKQRGFDRNRRNESDGDEDEGADELVEETDDEVVERELLDERAARTLDDEVADRIAAREALQRAPKLGRSTAHSSRNDETDAEEPVPEEDTSAGHSVRRSRMAGAREQLGRAVTGAKSFWSRVTTRTRVSGPEESSGGVESSDGEIRPTERVRQRDLERNQGGSDKFDDERDDEQDATNTAATVDRGASARRSTEAKPGWAKSSAAKLGAVVTKVATASRERLKRGGRAKAESSEDVVVAARPRPRREAVAVVPRSGVLRTLFDFTAALVIAVTLFRTFVAEGYWIETGSMATSLLGHHLQAECYACGHKFPTEVSGSIEWARCPNCQAGSIKTDALVHGDGDQLLVFRPLFDHVRPERFSVVVFRNPVDPDQAFVKRVVGFPGEELRIERGDLYINGELQRKPLLRQRSMRVMVHDLRDRPAETDAEWKPRWVASPVGPAASGTIPGGGTAGTGWSVTEAVWKFRPASAGGDLAAPAGAKSPPDATIETAAPVGTNQPLEWIEYRHWLRSGGQHATMVTVDGWPRELDPLTPGIGAVTYDPSSRNLVVRGVLAGPLRDQLTNPNLPPPFREAVTRLADASHLAPIRDDSSYNRRTDGGGRNEVRDLMVAARVTFVDAQSVLVFALSDGREQIECRFQASNRTVQMFRSGETRPLAEAIWPDRLQIGRDSEIECSLWDAQCLVAVDGEPVLPAWTYTPTGPGQTAWRPVRIGAQGGAVDVADLRLYRDVHYTGGKELRGTQASIQLGPDEYFMLGDNSPVSRDSRSWPATSPVRAELFLGKPFVVHLPTRRRPARIGPWTIDIRIPEFSRMRYIR